MNTFAFVSALLVALGLQLTWAGILEVRGATPDLLLLLALAAAWRSPFRIAVLSAWLAGIAKDCGSAERLGTYGLLFAFAGMLLYAARPLLSREHPWVQMAVAFAASLIVNAIYGSIATFTASGGGWESGAAGRVIAIALYTACAAPFLLGPIDRIRGWIGLGAVRSWEEAV